MTQDKGTFSVALSTYSLQHDGWQYTLQKVYRGHDVYLVRLGLLGPLLPMRTYGSLALRCIHMDMLCRMTTSQKQRGSTRDTCDEDSAGSSIDPMTRESTLDSLVPPQSTTTVTICPVWSCMSTSGTLASMRASVRWYVVT